MRIKIKATFLSPSTNRMLAIGEEMNVVKNQFWLKRLNAGDVEQLGSSDKEKSKPAEKQSEESKQPKAKIDPKKK